MKAALASVAIGLAVATGIVVNDIEGGPMPAPTDVRIVPGLSTFTDSVSCKTVTRGSGWVYCPGHSFQTGQGLLAPFFGNAFPTYGAPTKMAAGPIGSTSSDRSTRCYRLVPLDGAQGYGMPSGETCTSASAPATPREGDYVKVTWINGATPPPAYALYEGASGGPYALVDYFGNEGLGLDYGRAKPKPEFWLPSSISGRETAQRDAVHGLATVSGAYIDVGVGFALPSDTAVTLYHDNALPIRYAIVNERVGACVQIPIGSYPISATSFGGSTLTSNGQCLLGSDRFGTKLRLMTGIIGAPFLSETGTAPSVSKLTIDANGFSSDENGILDVSAATSPLAEDFSFQHVSKNAVANSNSRGAVFRRFDAQGMPDFANQSAFLHDVHNIDTTVEEFSVVGFGFDLADKGCEIRKGSVSNFVSAGMGTEQDPFASACRMHDNVLRPAATKNQDINATITECIESWAPDDAIENNVCVDPIGSGFSIGGKRSRVTGNATSTTTANPNSAYVMRLDSAIYNAAGSVVRGNTDTGAFAYGLGEVGTAATCTGCVFDVDGLFGVTAVINRPSLRGGESFVRNGLTSKRP